MTAKAGSRNTRQIETVNRVMDGYAALGVFRRYGARPLSGGRIEHTFLWLADQSFTMIHDPARSTLTFRDLLPGIEPRSAMDRQLREFISGRSAKDLPSHRRMDPRRIRARCMNRGGSVSLIFQISAASAEYAARKAVEVVNEVFFAFLSREHHEYMVRQFNLPQE